MSRQLPQQPNLDHLKKQAKALLGDLQIDNPNAKLADALHAVAKSYGFATWPVLKAHVESIRVEPSARPASPFAGRWIADLARSKRHPANQFRSATMSFALEGNTLTLTHDVVDESGREDRGTQRLVVDGREHALPSGNGYSVIATWRGSSIFETIARKNGEIVDRGTYEVSGDGSLLTISASEQTLVLARE